MSVKTQRPFSFCTAFIEPFLFEWTNDPIFEGDVVGNHNYFSSNHVFTCLTFRCHIFCSCLFPILWTKGVNFSHQRRILESHSKYVVVLVIQGLAEQAVNLSNQMRAIGILPPKTDKISPNSTVNWDDWPAGKNLPRFLYSLVVVTCQNSINSIDSCSIIGEVYHPPRWMALKEATRPCS